MAYLRRTAVGALAVPFLLLVTACGSDNTGPAPPPNTVFLTSSNTFNPGSLTVIVGTTVTWQWQPGASHNVAPVSGNVPARSGAPVAAPNTYTFTFNTPGTFGYYCEVHGSLSQDGSASGMVGTIIVQ